MPWDAPPYSLRVDEPGEGGAAGLGPDEAEGDGRDVLIVDDDPTNLSLLADMLGKRGYRVRLANGGRRALTAAQARVPDLVMLDISMPEMDGFTVCERLKADPATREVPVVFLSALDEVIDKVRAFAVGGADYVTKPFELGEVLVRLEKELALSRLRRQMARRNAELERKNAELERKNQELARRTEELLQSQERATRVFSTLTGVLPGYELDGRYRLEARIGTGGFGAVYRARQLALDRQVAVKVLQPALTDESPEALRRLLREGVAACRVNHPNAVTVFDSGVSPDGVAYLVMELLEGRSLADELAGGTVLSPERCVAIAVPVCRVLAEAHAAGIVHRDIKPSNIFLHRAREQEVVKVVDFGTAKLLHGEAGAADPAHRTQLVGTPAYLAPERLQRGIADGRADIYSLGVTLYEMLSGALPCEEDSLSGWLAAAARGDLELRPLQSRNPALPAGLVEAVMRALSRDPAARPTAPELEQALLGALAGLLGAGRLP